MNNKDTIFNFKKRLQTVKLVFILLYFHYKASIEFRIHLLMETIWPCLLTKKECLAQGCIPINNRMTPEDHPIAHGVTFK